MQIRINETLVYSTRWDEETIEIPNHAKAEVQIELIVADERHEALSSSRMSLTSFMRGPSKGHVAF